MSRFFTTTSLLFLLGSSAAYAEPFAVWRGTDLNDIQSGQFRTTSRGRIVRIDLRAPGIGDPIASQECGAAVLFVYGAGANLGEFRVVSERLRRIPVEQYFYDYDVLGREAVANAADLALNIRQFRASQRDRSCRLVVVAHSMGGLIARASLNSLANVPASEIGMVEVVTIDTPWHGYNGPSDEGLSSLMLLFARPFTRQGFLDLRSRSSFMTSLNGTLLPSHLRYRIYFAADGEEVRDYSELPNSAIVRYIQSRYLEHARPAVSPSPSVKNLWDALVWSDNFTVFDQGIQRHLSQNQLSEEAIHLELERAFPHFEGSHSGVLHQAWDFAEYVSYDVARMIEEDTRR